MPNIASKIAQHRANIGQHRPNIGQPRPNIGSTWAQDAPSIDHMGPTWLNLGRRCAPDSFTLLHIGPTKANIGEREREREARQDMCKTALPTSAYTRHTPGRSAPFSRRMLPWNCGVRWRMLAPCCPMLSLCCAILEGM